MIKCEGVEASPPGFRPVFLTLVVLNVAGQLYVCSGCTIARAWHSPQDRFVLIITVVSALQALLFLVFAVDPGENPIQPDGTRPKAGSCLLITWLMCCRWALICAILGALLFTTQAVKNLQRPPKEVSNMMMISCVHRL